MSSDDATIPVTSSLEPELAENQRRLYREVLSILHEHHIPCAVSGAFSLQHHTGIFRPAKDLDLVLTSETAVRVLDLLDSKGFVCKVCDGVWLAKAFRDGHFVDFITGMSNGALYVTESWISRSVPESVLGVPANILAAEELLVSKLFVTRRERFDGADIAHIIYGTRGRLDWNRMLELAGEHWEILLWSLILFQYAYPAQRSYVPLPVWTDLINGLRSRLLDPDPSERFRGSLIDENMFAIDVNEWGLDNLFGELRRDRLPKIDWQPKRDRPQRLSDEDAA